MQYIQRYLEGYGVKMSIKLELTVDEVNGILNALGHLPYSQVVNLIENIRSQAVKQINNPKEGD
jgi:hypothetical protein